MARVDRVLRATAGWSRIEVSTSNRCTARGAGVSPYQENHGQELQFRRPADFKT
jgi:hypothetical protein